MAATVNPVVVDRAPDTQPRQQYRHRHSHAMVEAEQWPSNKVAPGWLVVAGQRVVYHPSKGHARMAAAPQEPGCYVPFTQDGAACFVPIKHGQWAVWYESGAVAVYSDSNFRSFFEPVVPGASALPQEFRDLVTRREAAEYEGAIDDARAASALFEELEFEPFSKVTDDTLRELVLAMTHAHDLVTSLQRHLTRCQALRALTTERYTAVVYTAKDTVPPILYDDS